MANTSITLTTKVSEKNGKLELTSGVYQIPKNVIDADIFYISCQLHINNMMESQLVASETKIRVKYDAEVVKNNMDVDLVNALESQLTTAENLTKKWKEHVTNFNKEVSNTYDTKVLYEQLKEDAYARLFSLSVLRAKRIGENDIAFTNSKVSQERLFRCIREITLNRSLTKEETNEYVTAVKIFINDNFGTEAVAGLYKKSNLSKLTANKIRENVGTCLTKRANHSNKGLGIQKDYITPFEVALECLFLFYGEQGISEYRNVKKVEAISGNSGKMDLSKIQKKTK